jgi:hypothetical protein
MSSSLAIPQKSALVVSKRVYHMMLYAVAREIAYQQLRSTDSNQLKLDNTSGEINRRSIKRSTRKARL